MKKKSICDQVGDRMKQREKQLVTKVVPTDWIVVRCDGNNFSSFTKRLHQPFDKLFVRVSMKVLNDVMKKYLPSLGFSCSDEFTFVFPPKCTKEEYDEDNNKHCHIYGGKNFKFETYIASYVSVRFNLHMINEIKKYAGEYDTEFVKLIEDQQQIFDGRILVFKDGETQEIITKNKDGVDETMTVDLGEGEVLNHMIWRSVLDCRRNTISQFSRHIVKGKKTLMNKNCGEMIEMMKEHNFDFEKDVPNFLKYGIYIKKIPVNTVITLKDGTKKDVSRCTNQFRSMRLKWHSEMMPLIRAKLWKDLDTNLFDVDLIHVLDIEKLDIIDDVITPSSITIPA